MEAPANQIVLMQKEVAEAAGEPGVCSLGISYAVRLASEFNW